MSKPKIFIAMHYLEIGGAEAALIGMLHAFDYEKLMWTYSYIVIVGNSCDLFLIE